LQSTTRKLLQFKLVNFLCIIKAENGKKTRQESLNYQKFKENLQDSFVTKISLRRKDLGVAKKKFSFFENQNLFKSETF